MILRHENEYRSILNGTDRVQSYTPNELNRMIRDARRGCTESLGSLLEAYRSYLRLVVSLQLDRKLQTKCSPSDIVQMTFLRAQQGFGNFGGATEAELVAWLRKILVSQLLTEIRRYSTQARDLAMERKLNTQVDQSSALMMNMIAGTSDSPSETAIKRERAVLLADALSQLPDNYRDVIVLRHLKAYRFSEVAEELGQSVDSVKAVWRRAINRLRTLIGNGHI